MRSVLHAMEAALGYAIGAVIVLVGSFPVAGALGGILAALLAAVHIGTFGQLAVPCLLAMWTLLIVAVVVAAIRDPHRLFY